jgi:hypothetical protein
MVFASSENESGGKGGHKIDLKNTVTFLLTTHS